MKSASLESMLGRKILFLSPHADDVAYSVGGLVAQLAMRSDLHLITIFGRSGWALPETSRGKSADEISAEREREDRAYCARRWIKYELLPCPDSFTAGYDEVTELSSAATDDPRTGGRSEHGAKRRGVSDAAVRAGALRPWRACRSPDRTIGRRRAKEH